MKDYDYHSLFYYEIMARLQNLRDGNGNLIKAPKGNDRRYQVEVGFEPRPGRFPHNYMRDKFIAERPRFVVFTHDGQRTVLMRVERFRDEATIYKKAVRHVFKNNTVVAKRELESLMEKFYDLKEEDQSNLEYVDFSADPGYQAADHVDIRLNQKKADKEAALRRRAQTLDNTVPGMRIRGNIF